MAKRYDPILCMMVDEPTKAQDAMPSDLKKAGYEVGTVEKYGSTYYTLVYNGKVISTSPTEANIVEKAKKHYANRHGKAQDELSLAQKKQVVTELKGFLKKSYNFSDESEYARAYEDLRHMFTTGSRKSISGLFENTVKKTGAHDAKAKDKLVKVPDSKLKDFEANLRYAGFKVVSKSDRGKSTHYQVEVNSSKQFTEADLREWAYKIDAVCDKMSSVAPTTWNIGLTVDGKITAGLDVREMYVKDSASALDKAIKTADGATGDKLYADVKAIYNLFSNILLTYTNEQSVQKLANEGTKKCLELAAKVKGVRDEAIRVHDASTGHKVVVFVENYLRSIGKNNSTGKYDKIVHGVRSLLSQSLLDDEGLKKAAEHEADRLLKKYNL